MSESRTNLQTSPTLMVKNPSGGKQRVTVGRLPFRIGRQGDNDLVLRDSRASRQHAQIVSEDDGYAVDALASARVPSSSVCQPSSRPNATPSMTA